MTLQLRNQNGLQKKLMITSIIKRSTGKEFHWQYLLSSTATNGDSLQWSKIVQTFQVGNISHILNKVVCYSRIQIITKDCSNLSILLVCNLFTVFTNSFGTTYKHTNISTKMEIFLQGKPCLAASTFSCHNHVLIVFFFCCSTLPRSAVYGFAH